MADCIIQRAGGGAGSDECTAVRAQVLAGFTAVTKDSGDEPVVGSMVNRGAVSQDLNCGGSFTVPAGYHDGAGIVRANSLASQTGGCTAEDKYVLSSKTYWKDGVKRTGTMTVNSVVSFSVAAYSTSQILATWTNPNGPYSGFIICGKTGGYPTNVDDNRRYAGVGSNRAVGAKNTVTISGLTPGTLYYFRIWVYLTCSAGELRSGYIQTTGKPTAHGRQVFTSSGTFTVPAGVRLIDVHATGGGGGGCYGVKTTAGSGGSGGGGGHIAHRLGHDVTPGQKIEITVGAGGGGGGTPNGQIGDKGEHMGGTRGGGSRVGNIIINLMGGSPGVGTYASHPDYLIESSGGSGGGEGALSGDDYPGNGGSNGSNGYLHNDTAEDIIAPDASPDDDFHRFQGGRESTREFGTGTLYSGGGGGGTRWYNYAEKYRSIGGAGGGGDGTWQHGAAKPGGAGTGGGGGGGGRNLPPMTYEGAAGGSGNVIIRW